MMLYCIATFSISLISYCIRSTSSDGRVALLAIFGISVITGSITALFFRRVWGAFGGHVVKGSSVV